MLEQWHSVTGQVGKYLISDLGRVMNNHGHIMKTMLSSTGAQIINTTDGKTINVGREVARAFVDNPNAYQQIKYKDGNKLNCNADNIEWCEADFSNDSMPIPITLIKDGIAYPTRSIKHASIIAGVKANNIKVCINNKKMIVTTPDGYAAARTDDAERIAELIAYTANPAPDLPNEQWKDIEGCEGYLVSSLGRIKSTRYHYPKILTNTTQQSGYVYVSFSINGKRHCLRLNRLVAQAFLPNPDNLPEVDHINGDKTNNTVSNLEWVTRQENVKREWDAIMKKRRKV